MKTDDLLFYLALIRSSVGIQSFFWMLLRCLPIFHNHNSEMETLVYETELKEIGYSQTRFHHQSHFTYDDLHLPEYDLPIEIPSSWARVVRKIVDNVRAKLRFGSPLLPSYTRRKNIGYESARRFIASTGRDKDQNSITTFDLEHHYATTGEQTQGPCEVRQVWRFNELKPRFYYAQGATSYHASKYMKQIANVFMDSNPSTRTANRTDPTSYINMTYNDQNHVVIWDLTSFTTNLSELPFFLSHLIQAIDQEFGDSATIPIIDLRDGLQHVKLQDLMQTYLEECTIGSEFSIERLTDIQPGFDDIYRSQNSGLLGVPGNIGFSTTLHGYIAAQLLGPENTVAIGDDAIGCVDDPESLIQHIQELGIIQREKFGVMGPHEDGQVQSIRFLKRLMTRENDGLFLHSLLPLPIMPLLTQVIPEHNLRPRDFEYRDRVKKIVVIAYSLNMNPEFADALEDPTFRTLSQHYFMKLYNTHSLPPRGALPGHFVIRPDGDRVRIPWLIPPIIIKPTPGIQLTWLKQLFMDSTGYYELPAFHSPEQLIVPRFVPGDVFLATKSRALTILEDFGVVRLENHVELTKERTQQNFDVLERWISGHGTRVSIVTALMYPPKWFDAYIPEQSVFEDTSLGAHF